jgi:hypothetical protein
MAKVTIFPLFGGLWLKRRLIISDAIYILCAHLSVAFQLPDFRRGCDFL